MSFGFGVGDFIAVGELCWKIYTRVYKVSRDAPEELRALIQELGNLSNTVNLLNEEVRDREEWVKRAGERRLEYTCKVMGQAKETLQKMDRLADRYAELGKRQGSEGSKHSFRVQWNRVKFAFEVSCINELRAKVMIPANGWYQALTISSSCPTISTSAFFCRELNSNSVLHLVQISAVRDSSSLERIENQQTKTDMKLEELRSVVIGDRSSRDSPLLKAPLEEEVRIELSAAFLRSAETGNRPWASIGIDDWLRAGKWWLLKTRSQIGRLTQGHGDKTEAYINLLKACWILTDMVSIHPQRTHLGASNDRRNDDIRNLSQEGDQDKFPRAGFVTKDCLYIEVPLGAFAWKVICWYCENFASFRSLLEEFNVAEAPCDFVLQTAFLRLDPDFLNQLVQLWKCGDGWHPKDLCLMVEAAMTWDDDRYILWIFKRVAAREVSEHMTEISQLVFRSRRLQHVDAMMQVVVPRPADVAATLAGFLGFRDEKGFTDFLHMLHCRVGSFNSKVAENLDFSNLYPTFVVGCSRLIASRHPNSLGLYLDSLKELGIDFHTLEGRKNTESSQVALLSALASPDPAFLRILLEREAVVADMQPFIEEYVSWKNSDSSVDVHYASPLVPHSALQCAVMLVCDAEFLRLLCQHGASSPQYSKDTRDYECEVSVIIEQLSKVSRLEDARLEYMSALLFCYIIIHVRKKGEHYGSLFSDSTKATEKITEQAWRYIKHLLYRDSFFTDGSFPYHRLFTGKWKTEFHKRSKVLLPRFIEAPDHYSEHLRTQESWDTWRREALQILRR
ncbi:hypothetical protein FBULB1_282 [Fusarium bulbicola]|nr:hypothetical protein FBULB1_282 [Fusarium bulbicola]